MLKVVTGTHDVYKVLGYMDFDLVYLTDCHAMNYFMHVREEILFRTRFPEWHGSIYYIET